MGQLLHTFTVENTDEIIPKIKQDYGDEAMLVTQKQIRAKTLTQKPLYEVIVAIEEKDYQAHLAKIGKATPSANSAKAQNSSANLNSSRTKTDDDVVLDFSQRAKASRDRAYEQAAQPKEPQNNSLKDFGKKLSEAAEEISQMMSGDEAEKPVYDKKMEMLDKKITKLSEKVSILIDTMWNDKANLGDITIPPEFASIYKLAKASKMKEEHLQAIMKATIENMPASMKTNPDAVSRYFYSLLRNMLPCRPETQIRKQKIMMFVGPTGVGKTTTLAKLAFRYAYGDKRYKTGIITLDTYRIGAVEQLFQYAKMMKLPIIDSIEPKDLDEAIQTLSYCEVILVDTIGNSQYDQSKLAKTKEFLSHSNADIDVNLVVSANTKLEDLMEVYKNFKEYLDIDTLIITKFDETKVFGNIFSLIYDTNVPMSFFSVGQEVPDDIELASSDFLVKCVLEGFVRKNDE